MFPLVPYHALPRLHAAGEGRLPHALPGSLIGLARDRPVVLPGRSGTRLPRQAQAPGAQAPPQRRARSSDARPDAAGWIEVCAAADLGPRRRDPLRPRQENLRALPRRGGPRSTPPTASARTATRTFRRPGESGRSSAPSTTGASTSRRLARARAGLPRPGHLSPGGAPRPLHLNVVRAGGAGAREQRAYSSSASSATGASPRSSRSWSSSRWTRPSRVAFTPGDYLQLDIPPTARSASATSTSRSPSPRSGRPSTSSTSWPAIRAGRRNNYSIASNQQLERAALQRPHRHAAPGPGLPAGRRLEPTSSASSRATP
jgi:Na+-transporting NADH:ubiquinone oxidoreductase subunit F